MNLPFQKIIFSIIHRWFLFSCPFPRSLLRGSIRRLGKGDSVPFALDDVTERPMPAASARVLSFFASGWVGHAPLPPRAGQLPLLKEMADGLLTKLNCDLLTPNLLNGANQALARAHAHVPKLIGHHAPNKLVHPVHARA